jgi:hypothetical protein
MSKLTKSVTALSAYLRTHGYPGVSAQATTTTTFPPSVAPTNPPTLSPTLASGKALYLSVTRAGAVISLTFCTEITICSTLHHPCLLHHCHAIFCTCFEDFHGIFMLYRANTVLDKTELLLL